MNAEYKVVKNKMVLVKRYAWSMMKSLKTLSG